MTQVKSQAAVTYLGIIGMYLYLIEVRKSNKIFKYFTNLKKYFSRYVLLLFEFVRKLK